MQGLQCHPLPAKTDLANPAPAVAVRRRRTTALSIDGQDETPESRIERLIREHLVVIFARRGCCMCHVMKRLLAAVGSHPSVIEIEENEVGIFAGSGLPALFVGGEPVGGIEGLMGLHLAGRLVPRLREVGAIYG
ncbi:hypothetical protein LUZ60_009306 [Juncus effusus]|nr:hypothetical protein LUZ60_009306 [Juncus effusus]